MSTKSAHNLNLKQCLEIQGNMYRSKDNLRDYDQESVDNRVNQLKSRRDAEMFERLVKERNSYLVEVEMTGAVDELPPDFYMEGNTLVEVPDTILDF